MQRYKCSNCNKVFCGWAVKYKLKYKCPVCGGELRVIPSNKKIPGRWKDIIKRLLKSIQGLF